MDVKVNNREKSFNILYPGLFDNECMLEIPMIVLWYILCSLSVAYDIFSIKKNVSTICEKDSVCVCIYTKKISV